MLGIAAGDLLRSRVFCLAKWRNDYNPLTQHTLSVDTPWPTADALYDSSEQERTAKDSQPQSHEHEHIQIVGKIVEFPEILIVEGIQQPENSRTVAVRRVECAGLWKCWSFLWWWSMFNVLPWPNPSFQRLPLNYTAPARLVGYKCPAPAAHPAPAPVVEYVAPSPVTEYMTQSVHTPVVQVGQVSQLQTIGIIIETRITCSSQDTQTSESLSTAPIRQMKPAESMEVVELRPSLSAEPVPPTRVTPVVDVPPVVVEHVLPDPATEHAAPAPAVSDPALAPVVD